MPLWSKARLESRTLRTQRIPRNACTKCSIELKTRGQRRPKRGLDWVGDHASHRTKPIDTILAVLSRPRWPIPLLHSQISLVPQNQPKPQKTQSRKKSWQQMRKPRRTLRETCSRPLSPCFLLHDLDQFFDCWFVSALLNWYISHHFFTMAFLGSPSWPRKAAPPVWIWPILVFCIRRCAPWIFASDHTCPSWELLFQAVIKNLGRHYHRCNEILKESDPQTCEVVFKSCYLSFDLWGWMTWSSRGTHFLKCMLSWTPTTTNWRIVLPSCQHIEHCGTSAVNIYI